MNVFESVVFKDGSTKSLTEKDIKTDNIAHILLSYSYSFGQDPIEFKITDFNKYFEIKKIIDVSENQ